MEGKNIAFHYELLHTISGKVQGQSFYSLVDHMCVTAEMHQGNSGSVPSQQEQTFTYKGKFSKSPG